MNASPDNGTGSFADNQGTVLMVAPIGPYRDLLKRVLRKELEDAKRRLATGGAADLAASAVDGVVVARVDGLPREGLRDLASRVQQTDTCTHHGYRRHRHGKHEHQDRQGRREFGGDHPAIGRPSGRQRQAHG